MQTLDQSLTKLAEMGIVSVEDARSRAKDAGEFDRLMEVTEVAAEAETEAFVPGVAPTSGVRGQPNRPGYRRE